MNRFSIFLGRTSACFALLGAISCEHEQHEAHAIGKLLVTSPHRTDVELTRDYVAQIRAFQHIEVRAIERGYLQGTFVDEGQAIAKGTRMFQIVPLIYQAEVQKASAEASLASIELANTKLLADQQIVSPNELALAKAKVDKANAEVSLATTHRSMTEVRAPFDGIMGRLHVRMGSLIDEGELLTTLSDNSKMWVYFNVSEAEYLRLKKTAQDTGATPVKLVMANGEVFDQLGSIEAIDADFNNETGNLAFRATFANPNGLLRHGQTGTIVMSIPLDDALVIPQMATFDVLDKKFVFVVDEKNVVRARPITVSAELPQVFVVEGGLAERDKILVEGLRKVRDGMAIETSYEKPPELLGRLEVPAE
jgi:membrane fusion protein (multidrug efflux system)